ncbi:MAG: hypothetical protein SV375_12195 [Thermodesulfobacteriota bacterium]|nr:hypothetical protein [Thermodesulfobacteriota bacterium]
MKNTLKISIDDISFLSGYLHDALILKENHSVGKESETFECHIERICYEAGEKRKAFFIFPVVKYPTIKSKISFTNIINYEEKTFDEDMNTWGENHRLLEIALTETDKSELKIIPEHKEIAFQLKKDAEIFLEDISDPSNKMKVTDFSRSIFPSLNEIKKFKDRNPTLAFKRLGSLAPEA